MVLVWLICNATVSPDATENVFAVLLFVTIVPAELTVMLTCMEVVAPAPVPLPLHKVAVMVSVVADAVMTPDMKIFEKVQAVGITV